MLADLLFERIPHLFIWLFAYFRDSKTYSLLRRAYCWVAGKCMESRIGQLLRGSGRELFAASGLCSCLDAILGFLHRIAGRIICALSFGTNTSLFLSAGAYVFEPYKIWNFEFLTGVFLMVMFLCPGDSWSNLYGLAGAGGLLILYFLLVSAGKRKALTFKAIGFPLTVFAIASVIGVGVSSNLSDGIRVFVFFATSIMLSVLMVAVITDKDKLKKILFFIYIAVVLTGAVGFVQRVLGVEINESLTDVATNSSMPGRVFSTFDNPNNYAEFLVMMLPLCAAFCYMVKNKYARAVCILFLAIPFGALLMTYSRSGWVSFALAAVIFLFLFKKSLLPILAAAAIFAVPLLPTSIYNRLLTIGSTKDSSNMYRLYIWEGVLRMLKHYWVTGVGLGPLNFRSVYLIYCNSIASPAPHSHMLYLEIWIETGIVGIVSYFAYLFYIIRNALLSLKRACAEVRITMIAGVSALGGIAFAAAAEYIWYYPRVMFSYFIVTGILAAAINIARNEKKDA